MFSSSILVSIGNKYHAWVSRGIIVAYQKNVHHETNDKIFYYVLKKETRTNDLRLSIGTNFVHREPVDDSSV